MKLTNKQTTVLACLGVSVEGLTVDTLAKGATNANKDKTVKTRLETLVLMGINWEDELKKIGDKLTKGGSDEPKVYEFAIHNPKNLPEPKCVKFKPENGNRWGYMPLSVFKQLVEAKEFPKFVD
jgi:hypothetical protein